MFSRTMLNYVNLHIKRHRSNNVQISVEQAILCSFIYVATTVKEWQIRKFIVQMLQKHKRNQLKPIFLHEKTHKGWKG